MIVQALHDIQKAHGYLPKAELKSLSIRTGTPLHRLHEVASFFPHFRLQPPPPVEALVCRDMACHLRGAPALRGKLELVREEVGSERLAVEGVSCLGRCDRAPVACINDHNHVAASPEKLAAFVRDAVSGVPSAGDLDADLPADPATWLIEPSAGRIEFSAARRFLMKPDADAVLKALEVGDLRGMGGAGVWAHKKWRDVRDAAGRDKYIVCNADESEPGTFKDRELLLRVPHLVLEGVILAGLITNASAGYVYIRHEYREQIQAMREAIRQAEKLGVCGNHLQGTDRAFPVEVFVSPGGYICGEQSALIEAMEDRRAEPRNKPPQLETNGLYDKPTLVSNVETFAWAPVIATRGGEWYRDQGAHGCKGRRFFSVCGDVNRPGVYEVPNGIRLRDLLSDHAGGIRDGKPLKAFAPSGPSGGFLPRAIPLDQLPRGFEKRLPEQFVRDYLPPGSRQLDVLDIPLDLQIYRDLGLMLGAGMVVYAKGTDMLDQALNCLEFFRNESCGKCVPCRIGSQKLVEIGAGLHESKYDGQGFEAEANLVRELARTMGLTSICGLGTVAANPLTHLLQYFREDVEKYLSRNGSLRQA
jgi:NADH:ubiquinone oxidoreductase subunit F (NADH-binding)/NADH:ubiquinone oxidoreductase subunit E